MKELFFYLSQYLVVYVILFLVFFGLLIGLIMRKDAGRFFIGFFKIIFSIFYAPVFYIQKAVHRIAKTAEEKETEEAGSRQYFLTKLLFYLELVIILSVVFYFVNGLIGGWIEMVPSKELVRQRESAEKDLIEGQKFESDLKNLIMDEQADWSQKSDSIVKMVNTYKDSAVKIIRADANEKLVSVFLGSSNAQAIANRIINTDYKNQWNSRNVVYYRRDISGAILNLNRLDEQNLLFEINSGLAAARIFELSNEKNYTSENLRAILRPQYELFNDKHKETQKTVQSRQSNLNQLIELTKWKFSAFFKSILYEIVSAFIAVWVFGLALEFIALQIDIARNIRKMTNKE